MIIEEWFGNDYFGNLVIQNYPNLQSIIIENNSVTSLKSLKICNCEKLKIIEIENGIDFDGTFRNVKKVIIDSIYNNSTLVYIFLI